MCALSLYVLRNSQHFLAPRLDCMCIEKPIDTVLFSQIERPSLYRAIRVDTQKKKAEFAQHLIFDDRKQVFPFLSYI